jgi:hypothetical protein
MECTILGHYGNLDWKSSSLMTSSRNKLTCKLCLPELALVFYNPSVPCSSTFKVRAQWSSSCSNFNFQSNALWLNGRSTCNRRRHILGTRSCPNWIQSFRQRGIQILLWDRNQSTLAFADLGKNLLRKFHLADDKKLRYTNDCLCNCLVCHLI